MRFVRASQLTDGRVVFHGSPARDVFQNNTTLRSTVFGYEGDDQIYGSKNSKSGDAIWGVAGTTRFMPVAAMIT